MGQGLTTPHHKKYILLPNVTQTLRLGDSDQVKEDDEIGGACSKKPRDEKYVHSSGRKPEGKRRPERRWEDNMRMNHREIWWEVVDRMHLVQDGDQ
jgi:hypothetical protein